MTDQDHRVAPLNDHHNGDTTSRIDDPGTDPINPVTNLHTDPSIPRVMTRQPIGTSLALPEVVILEEAETESDEGASECESIFSHLTSSTQTELTLEIPDGAAGIIVVDGVLTGEIFISQGPTILDTFDFDTFLNTDLDDSGFGSEQELFEFCAGGA
ncbi:hypothetical protein BDV12DRAFT_119863 [Aspergillus spectabilis]